MTRQPIEKQTNSITHCLVYKAPSNQFDSLCPPPPPPPVNWLISLDSVNWLVVVALCGHSSHFVRPRTELKFLVWIKTSWGIGLLAPQGGMLHFDKLKWYEIWALCNLLGKDSQCVLQKRLSPALWALSPDKYLGLKSGVGALTWPWIFWIPKEFYLLKEVLLLQSTCSFILLGRKHSTPRTGISWALVCLVLC